VKKKIKTPKENFTKIRNQVTSASENGGRGFSHLEILQHNQIASLKNYFLNRARDNTFFKALVSADKGYTPLNLSDNIISDIVEPNIPHYS
jgi:hypothetical protein